MFSFIDKFNMDVSEKGWNWMASQWISGGFETGILWPLEWRYSHSPKVITLCIPLLQVGSPLG